MSLWNAAPSDERTAELLAGVDDRPTRFAVSTERAFLAELGAGCTLPLGALCVGGALHGYLAASAELGEGSVTFRETVEVPRELDEAIALAAAMARRARAAVGA